MQVFCVLLFECFVFVEVCCVNESAWIGC